jgi:hypothetical protein
LEAGFGLRHDRVLREWSVKLSSLTEAHSMRPRQRVDQKTGICSI